MNGIARYRIRHVSSYAYELPVVVSHHLLHLCPRNDQGQQLLTHQLTIDCVGARVQDDVDYFGNSIAYLELAAPYRQLSVVAQSEVTVARLTPHPEAASPSWEMVANDADPALTQWRCNSVHLQCSSQLADFARRSFSQGRAILPAFLHLMRRIQSDFRYQPGATDVSTPLPQVLAQACGVCQDFAHLAIGALRSLGIPARYVSGYLETMPPPGQPRLLGADASHAWVSCWCGPELGWIDGDPTNGCLVGQQHIQLAIGRDFADVSPITGVIYGGGMQSLQVGVDVVPEREWASFAW